MTLGYLNTKRFTYLNKYENWGYFALKTYPCK